MKLSNKILLGFFGFIFMYLTAVFAEFRLTGIPNIIDDKNSIAETVDISGVSYLILKDVNKQIDVIGADRAQLEVRSLSGGLLTKLKYKISGDTLTVSGLQSEGIKTIKISVFIPKTSLKGIMVNSSGVSVDGLQSDLLNISQSSGRIWMSNNKIANVRIDLSNRSFLDVNSTSLDTLSANIEGSQVHISSPVGLVQGSMKNNSLLRLGDIREIQLKKDESSRLNIY